MDVLYYSPILMNFYVVVLLKKGKTEVMPIGVILPFIFFNELINVFLALILGEFLIFFIGDVAF